MRYIKSTYSGDTKELKLYPIGDLHIGNPLFRKDLLLNVLKGIDKENSRIILMGDILEVGLKDSIGASVYEQKSNVQEQVQLAKEIFWDYRDIIDGYVIGNHENRVWERSGLDLALYLSQVLGIENKYLRYQGLISYAWNRRSYTIHAFHGAGGGTTLGSAINKVVKQSDIVSADLYLAGHTHQVASGKKDYFVPDSRSLTLSKQTQVFVACGSMLDYEEGYAEAKGLLPTTLEIPVVRLSGEYLSDGKVKKDIKVNI